MHWAEKCHFVSFHTFSFEWSCFTRVGELQPTVVFVNALSDVKSNLNMYLYILNSMRLQSMKTTEQVCLCYCVWTPLMVHISWRKSEQWKWKCVGVSPLITHWRFWLNRKPNLSKNRREAYFCILRHFSST